MSIRTASFALVAGLALAAPASALAAPTEPVPAQVEKTTAPAPAQQQDAASYADREQADKKVADYEGGQVVIYMSGAALIALIIILILL
jgi:uncharacterized membrane protein